MIAWFHLFLVVRSPSPPNSGVVDVRRTQSALAAAYFQAVGCTRCDDLWGQLLIYGSYAFVGGYREVPQLFRPIGPPAPPSAGVHDGQGVDGASGERSDFCCVFDAAQEKLHRDRRVAIRLGAVAQPAGVVETPGASLAISPDRQTVGLARSN